MANEHKEMVARVEDCVEDAGVSLRCWSMQQSNSRANSLPLEAQADEELHTLSASVSRLKSLTAEINQELRPQSLCLCACEQGQKKTMYDRVSNMFKNTTKADSMASKSAQLNEQASLFKKRGAKLNKVSSWGTGRLSTPTPVRSMPILQTTKSAPSPSSNPRHVPTEPQSVQPLQSKSMKEITGLNAREMK